METTEIWACIEGFDNCYEVSNKGRVRSHCARKPKLPHIMRPSTLPAGYKTVRLGKSKKLAKSRYVHRLVAFAFVEGYRDGYVVNHIDFDPANNQSSNLEWVTVKGNVAHTIAAGRRVAVGLKGSAHGNAKLTEKDVATIRKNYKRRCPRFGQKAMCRKYNISPSMMTYIVTNKYWTHI